MYKSLLFGLLTALFIFAGCSDDSPTDGDVPTDFSFSTKINGNAWNADTAIYREPVLPGFTKEIVAWIGPENLGEKITISLNKTVPGTYTLSGASNPDVVLQYVYDIDAGSAFNPDSAPATEGTVNITEVTSQYIAGTFTFKATGVFSGQTFNATEGAFKVKAQ